MTPDTTNSGVVTFVVALTVCTLIDCAEIVFAVNDLDTVASKVVTFVFDVKHNPSNP